MKNFLFLLAAVISPFQNYAQKLEATPKEALLIVWVKNEKEAPQLGQKIFFESKKTKKLFSGVTADSGKFEILVPKGDSYLIKYSVVSGNTDYTVLDIPDNEGELLSFDVNIQFATPKKYVLNNVYFEVGKAQLKPASFKYIDDVAEYLKLKKTVVIEISGHTDNVGSVATNLKLSQSRAESVRNYLIKKGVAANRIIAKGYGDTQPIEDNTSDDGRRKNRRTEVKILSE